MLGQSRPAKMATVRRLLSIVWPLLGLVKQLQLVSAWTDLLRFRRLPLAMRTFCVVRHLVSGPQWLTNLITLRESRMTVCILFLGI